MDLDVAEEAPAVDFWACPFPTPYSLRPSPGPLGDVAGDAERARLVVEDEADRPSRNRWNDDFVSVAMPIQSLLVTSLLRRHYSLDSKAAQKC